MSLPRIQRQIISRLKNTDAMQFSKLKPDSAIPNDLYNYHLKTLVKYGIIEKPQRGYYRLSDKGERRVADVHHTSDQADRLFKVNVLLIVVDRRPDGIYILNQFRTARPSYGITGIPGGTIRKAEPLLEGASRKLQEETGLSASFSQIGLERRILYKDGTLFSDVFFPFCIAESHSGIPITTEYGENGWVPIETAIENDARQYDRIESIARVLLAIQAGTSLNEGFYHEQIAHIES